MRGLASFACILLLTTACGDDDDDAPTPDAAATVDADTNDGAPADAMLPDNVTACLGDVPPATAPQNLLVRMHLVDNTGTSLSGVLLELHQMSDDAVVGSATTNGLGTGQMNVPTGGLPLDVYLRASKDGFVAFNLFFVDPLTENVDTSSNMITPTELIGAGEGLGLVVDDGKGHYAMQVLDCDGVYLGFVVIDFTPASEVYYFNSNGHVPNATMTFPSYGYVQGWNLEPGIVHVGQTLAGVALRGYNVKIFPGEYSFIYGRP